MSLFIREKKSELWERLSGMKYASGEMPEEHDIESPWYVRLMIGFSGWMAALFMLFFIGSAFDFAFKSKPVTFVIGAIMIGVAYRMLVMKKDSDFASQFALAVSFAGQVMVFFGLELFRYSSSGATLGWFIIFFIQLALAWFMPSSIHRLWSAFAAAIAFSIILARWQIIHIQPVIIMAVAAVLWLNEFKWIEYQQRLKPIAYGLIVALLYQTTTGALFFLFSRARGLKKAMLMQPWTGELLMGAVIIYVVYEILKRQSIRMSDRRAVIAFTGAVLLILVSLKIFGLTVGVIIMLLGYANGNRLLTAMGIFSLLYFISAYYYSMQTTLLVKSEILAVLGLVLLTASFLVKRVLFVRRGINDAK